MQLQGNLILFMNSNGVLCNLRDYPAFSHTSRPYNSNQNVFLIVFH